jgi:hypothetical protein
MTLKFTKYGFINGLISLIPIFPIWSLIPGVLAADAIGTLVNNCERGYRIVLWISIILSIIIIILYARNLNKMLLKNERKIKLNFRLWSLVLYTFVNLIGLIIVLGTYLACNGDGQTILACIYSGPIASLSLIAFGLIIDIKNNWC